MERISWAFILLSCIVQLNMGQNAPTVLLVNSTELPEVTVTEVPTTVSPDTPVNSSATTSTEFVDSGNSTDNNNSTSNRFPRGTVYQIRPVPFTFKDDLGKSPFLNNPDVDAVSDFTFPALKSLSSSEPASPGSPAFPSPASDSETSASSSATTFQLPKYLQAFVQDSLGQSSSSEEAEDQAQASARSSGFALTDEEAETPPLVRKSKKNRSVPASISRLPVAGDRSYAFGYTLDDHSRHEIADPQGNVNGYYTYIDDEGYLRKVVYAAGPGKGFVVLNKERKAGPLAQPVKKKKSTNSPPTIPTSTRKPEVVTEQPEPLSSNSSGEDQEELIKDRESVGSTKNKGSNSGLRKPIEYNRPVSVEEGVSESEYLPGGGFPAWLSEIAHGPGFPLRNSGRKPVFVVKIRRPHRHGHERHGNIHTLDYLPEGAVVATATPLTLTGTGRPLPSDHHARKRSRKISPNNHQTRIKQLRTPPVFLVSGGDDLSSSSSEESLDEYVRPAVRPAYRVPSPPLPSPSAIAELAGGDDDEDDGQWDGYLGDGTDGPAPPRRRSKSRPASERQLGTSNSPGGSNPDASYSFGYETDTANRLEKADGFGNVRGSYSYIDANGVKRTVHYVAGASTGFQVVGSSPSSPRSVRIEAPPGFLISRKSKRPSGGGDLSLTQAASSIQPSAAVVYHIHPDSDWRPWDGSGRKPRKMRKVMRMVRKKVRPTKEEMPLDDNPSTLMLQTHPDPENRPFRHSTRVVQDQALAEASKAFFERRRESHRAYTDIPKIEQPSTLLHDDQGPSKEPILYSGLKYEALSESRDSSRRIPNPILLRPSAVTIKNKGAAVETEVVRTKSGNPPVDQQQEVKGNPLIEGEDVAESIHSLQTQHQQQQPQQKSSSLRITTTTQSISTNGNGVVNPTVPSSTIVSATLEVTSRGTTEAATVTAPTTTTEAPDANAVQIARRRRRGPRNREEKKKTPSPVVIKMVTRDQRKEVVAEDDQDVGQSEAVRSIHKEVDETGPHLQETSMSSSIRLIRKLKRAT